MGEQLDPDRRPVVPPIDHGLEVPPQVRPAHLPAVPDQVRIDREPVGRQDAGGRPDQVVERGPVAVRADAEHRQVGRHRHPQPRPVPALLPAGLVHVRVESLRDLVGVGVDRPQRPAHGRFQLADRAERHGEVEHVGVQGPDGPLAEPPDAGQVGRDGRQRGAEPVWPPRAPGRPRCGRDRTGIRACAGGGG